MVSGHICQDHENVIKKGFKKIRAEAEKAWHDLDLTEPENIKKRRF